MIDCVAEYKADENEQGEFMLRQQVRKIWQPASVDCLEGQCGKFKPHASLNLKPVQLFNPFNADTIKALQFAILD